MPVKKPLPQKKIKVEDYYDGFAIDVDGVRYDFDQEDTRELLVDLFRDLGYNDVSYEEVY